MLQINEEFKNLIPPLTQEEYLGLERSILEEGIREPIITWNGVIVDGHNRYEIATKHGLEFDTAEYGFEDETAVKEWMIKNQLSRRNISAYQRSVLALQMKELIAAKAKAKEHERKTTRQNSDKSFRSIDTKRELANIAGVSHDTIAKVEKIEREAPEELRDKARRGEVSINAAYQELKKPHVAYNSGENEWYTPREYIDAARDVMGNIDLDPASSDIANKTVGASSYYTIAMDGLARPWFGRVWMNPPYSSDKIGRFISKLTDELPNIEQAIVLVNNATETAWFGELIENASAVCFPHGRIKFVDTEGKAIGAPLQGQALVYIGGDSGRFRAVFNSFGWTAAV